MKTENKAREYIIKHHKGVVVDNVEADDLLAIYGRATYDSFKETGKFKYVVVSFDNDYYNTHKDESINAWNTRITP